MAMNEFERRLYEPLISWFETLKVHVRTALSVGIAQNDTNREVRSLVDLDFDGWHHGDPSVTKNLASRCGDRTPGYITGNGLGSLEISAADD